MRVVSVWCPYFPSRSPTGPRPGHPQDADDERLRVAGRLADDAGGKTYSALLIAQGLAPPCDHQGGRIALSRMVNLTTLAPDIVAAILDETLPPDLTLFDLAVDPPALWDAQRSRSDGMIRQSCNDSCR